MFDEQDRKYFYDEFKNNGYEVGSYDDFKKDLNNKEDRDWYYNEAKNMGYDVGTQADFDKMVLDTSPSSSVPAEASSKQEPSSPQSGAQGKPEAQMLQVQQLKKTEANEEAEEPSLISQALGMMPKVDAGNVGREEKMGNVFSSMFGGEQQSVPSSQQQDQQPAPTAKDVDATTGAAPVQQVDAIFNKYVGKADAVSETMYDLLANGQAQNQEEAQQMAMGAMNRAAYNLAQRTTDDFVGKLGDSVEGIEDAINNGWYSHEVQDKLKKMAAQLGVQNSIALDENGKYITQTDGYDQFINGMVKPAMVESLVKKYGPNYRNIAEGIATRLYSHDENVQNRLMNQDINDALSDVIGKYTSTSVAKAIQDAEAASNAQMGKYNEQSKYVDSASPFAIGAISEANKTRDPQKILGDLQKKFGKLYQNPQFLNDMSNAAFKVMQRYGVNGGLSGDPKQFKPMINAAIKNELDQLEAKGMMPRGSADYILKTGIENTIIGKVSRKIMQTDYQNWLQDIANQQYQPGFWERVGSGALTFAGDAWSYWLPGAAGGKLTKNMIAKAEGKLASDLMAKGMETKMAERAAKVLIGKSKSMALKTGAASGAVTFGGQSAISKPIDEIYRTGQFDENGKKYNPSVGKVIANTLGEVAKQSAVGAIMQGGTIANMIGKGRGLASNILADLGGKAVDSTIMAGQQTLEHMAQDPSFKPTGKAFAESALESMANLTSIGLPGMMGKYARFKDANEFNRKFDFNEQDLNDLKRLGYDGLRDAFEKLGIGEYAVTGDNAQRLEGQLTQKYMDLMNDKSVPETLKAKMMAVVEGKRPSSFSPVVDSIIVQPMDNDGKVYLETLNKDGGVVDRKEYSSREDAEKADKKLEYEKTLGLASVMEGEFHKEFTQEHLDDLYNQAAQKYSMGEKLTDEEKAAVYLRQNAGAINDIMQKQQKGILLTPEEQKQVDAYRHFYDSALENSSVMREFVNTFEDSHGVARGTLRKALESRDKKYAPLVESYLKELYNSIELKREMKQTMDDLYNTSHGRDQERIEQKDVEGETTQNEGNTSPTDVPPTEPPTPPVEGETPTNVDRTPSVENGASPQDANTASSAATQSDAYVMGQTAYQNGDTEGLKAINHNAELAELRLQRAFEGDEKKITSVYKAIEEGKDMEQFVQQRSGYLTPVQQEAIRKYAEAMDAKKGVVDAVDHADDGYAESMSEQLWPYATEDGNIVPVTLTDGKTAFLKKANEYGGAFVATSDENGQPVVKQVSSAQIKETGNPVPFQDYVNQLAAQKHEATVQGLNSMFDGSNMQLNETVQVAMDPDSDSVPMQFVGYSEDGKVVLSDGKDKIALTKDEFDAWRTNALRNTINAELDAEDAQRANDDAAKAEASKQERYKKGIFGYAAGQPDYADPQTDPKVAAEYLQETTGKDRKALFSNIAAEKQSLQTRINQLKEHIANNEEWLSLNADLDPKNAETRTIANKQMQGKIADLQARFDNWNKIRSAVMTPEEATAIKNDRTKKIADAGVNESDITPIEGREVAVLSDEELKKQYPTMDEACNYITSERKRIYKIQSDEVQREIDGVDDVLNRYVEGEIDLEPEQIKELNTTKAQLQARQQNLTESAKELKAQADKLNTLYRKENAEARAKAMEDMTPAEQRAIKVETAIKNGNLSQLNSIYEDVRGATDFNDTEPNTLEEYVANNIGRFSLNYEGKEKGGAFSNGIQHETGLGRKDFDKLQILAKEGEGKTVPEFIHRLYDNMPEQLKQMGYTDQDIRDAFLNVIGSAEKYSDIKNYTLNNKVADVEQKMRALEEQEAEMREASDSSKTTDTATASLGGDTALSQSENSSSVGKETNNSDNLQEKGKKFSERLQNAIAETETEPTEAQKKAGNYKKGHLSFGGYDFTVETPKGTTRSGKDEQGKPWSVAMHDTYGYILGKIGVDGDHIDMFINDDADLDTFDGNVYVVDQVNPETGEFDEHKVMYGYPSEEAATEAYLANYSKDWKGLGKVTAVPKATFDKWLESSDRKTKPFADYAMIKKDANQEFISDMEYAYENDVHPSDEDKPKMQNFADRLLNFHQDREDKPEYGYTVLSANIKGDKLYPSEKKWFGTKKYRQGVSWVDKENACAYELNPRFNAQGYLTSVAVHKLLPFTENALSSGQKDDNLPFSPQMDLKDLPFDRDVKEVKPKDMTEPQKVAFEAVSAMLKKAGIPVKVISNEDMEKVAEEHDNLVLSSLLNSPVFRFQIKTPEQKEAAKAAYDWAKENRPDKYAQYAIVNMDNPSQMPEYFEKKSLAEQWRKYYTNAWKIGNYKAFDLNKPFEEQIKNVVGRVPDEFNPYLEDKKVANKLAELKKQKEELVKQRDELNAKLNDYNFKRNKSFFDAIMDYRSEHPGEEVPDSFIKEATDKSIGRYDPRPYLNEQIEDVEAKIKANNKEVAKLMFAGGGNISFMRTYHGSGADFDEFDFEHMGEGEGSQAFGWGGYVSSSKKIGKNYATLMDNDPSRANYRIQHSNGIRFKKKYPTLESFLKNDKQIAKKDIFTEQEKIDYYNEKIKLADPYHNLYEVEIPDDKGGNYLDWDEKPSAEAATKIFEGLYGLDDKTLDDMAARDIVFRSLLYNPIKSVDKEQMIPVLVKSNTLTRSTIYDNGDLEDNIRTVYNRLSRWMGSPKAASKFLSSLGFTGIKYKAGRNFDGAEDGDTNYVIFNPSDMQIVDHNKFAKGKGTVYGYTDGNEIVLNQEHLNPNTPIHEYQHIWRTAAKAKNPDLITHGDNLIKQTEWFKNLQNDPNYSHLSEEKLCDEAFARLTGDEGEAILEQMAKDAIKENPLDTAKELSIINRLKKWLKQFWYWTLETFTKWKPEDIKKMTLQDIRNLVLRDLAQGVDPRAVLKEHENGTKLTEKEKDDATERIDKRIAELNRQGKGQSLKSEHGNLAESHENGYLPSKKNLDGAQSVVPSSAKIDKKFPPKSFYLENLANFITSMGSNADISADNFTKKLFEGMGMTPHGKDTQVSEYFKYQTDDGGKTTVRLSDHSGNALSIIKKGGRADKGYSIVVRLDSSPKTKFKANKYSNVAEYVYENPDFNGLKDIARSVFNLIDTGEYLDLAGANEVHVSPRDSNVTKRFMFAGEKGAAEADNAEKVATLKQKQLEIVTTANPMLDDYHTGIRKVEDIKTFAESVKEAQEIARKGDYEEWASYPDETNDILQEALASGEITIYSSKPIIAGNFVTPSRMQAEDYSGYGKVYSKTVPVENVAWINVDEGQYAKVTKKSLHEIMEANEQGNRLNNLKVAKRMERGKKNAKTIKMATGWERGADGKWRYEMPDAKIKDTKDVGGKVVNRFEDDMLWNDGKLIDNINAPKLFEAYPQLKDIRINTDAIMNDMPSNGVYNPNTKTITIHADKLKYLNKILNHEIQHAIQDIEGFASGGTPKNVRERIEKLMADLEDDANLSKDSLEDYKRINTHLVQLQCAKQWEKNPKSFLKSSAKYTAPGYTMGTPKKEQIAIGQKLAEQWKLDANQFVMSRYYYRNAEDYGVRDNEKLLKKWSKQMAEQYADDKETAEKFDKLDKAIHSMTNYELYHALAGEVEARNVEARIDMSPEERRNSLASETEDVDRGDQIVMNNGGASYSIVKDPKEVERLNKEKTFSMFSAMQDYKGELYSPMAAIIDGKRTDPTRIGEWNKADERPDLVNDDGTFTLVKTDEKGGKKNGMGDVDANYAPYMHTSSSMMNDQFTGAYARGNIKVVEWEIPESEKTSGYRAEKSKKAVGLTPWHSGPVNALLPKNRQRSVMLSRWRKAVRVVPDSEVAESIAKQLAGTDLAIPWNVVTPNQLRELVKLGVPITTVQTGKQSPETIEKFKKQKTELEKEFPDAKFVDVKMTQEAYKKWGKKAKSPIVEEKLKNHPDSLIKTGTYFSGGGLVEEGLKGIIDPVVAVEYDKKISGVYRNNFGQHIVTADVRNVDPGELVKQIDGDVEYFHASPVCKNYSQAKANGTEVELDKETAKSTADFINAVKPRVVTIENVKGYRNSEAMKIITDALDKNGYKWDADVYNAADYGGYTNRERLIIRAVKDGKLPAKPKKQPRKGGWLEAVEDIIPTLSEKPNGVAPWMDARLKADGIDWENVKKPLYVMGSAYADGKIPHAYGDEILPTLRTKSGDVIIMPGGKVLRADGRVLARVSGMGDDYKLPETESLAHTIIGNGIPTQLTKAVIAPLLNKDNLSGRNILARLGKSLYKNHWNEDEQRKVADNVVNTANQLGGAPATVYTSLDEVPDAYLSDVKNGATGWYDPSTHTVHVYLPNCADADEAQRTVFHEKIGHEGMEVLLGGEQGVRKFANFVYQSADKETRGKILDVAHRYDPDWSNPDRMNVGTQEYIAHLAEDGPSTAEDFSLWTKIKHYLIKVLKKLGIRIPGLLNDKDLRYYLMKAGKALHVWDNMPREKQEAMMAQASNAEIKDALSDGAGKGKPRRKKDETPIQYMKRVMEWRKWKNAREDTEDPEPPMFYDFDKDAEGKKEWERLNKKWRDAHHLQGDEMPLRPERKEGESDESFLGRYKEWEKWNNSIGDKENPMPDMFSFEKSKQDEARQKYEDWLTRHELNEQQQADLDLYEGKIYPAETSPEADILDKQVMQDLAEVTSTDVGKEGAATTVKHAVIHRRKNMEEASAYDAIYINDIKTRIEDMVDSGFFDNLLANYEGKLTKAEKLAEAIPYIIEAPRQIRVICNKLNETEVFQKRYIHITPKDVEAIIPYQAQFVELVGKHHEETITKKNGDEVKVFRYDDPKAVTEIASKIAITINQNHVKEPGFVPLDSTDILGGYVKPIIAAAKVVPSGVDYKNLSPEMRATIRSIRDWYDYFYDWLKDNHTLKEDTDFVVDYINHIWDKEKSDKDAYAMYVENRQRTKSPNEKPRTISTLMEGLDVGLVPKTTDITKMMAYYSCSNIEAWANKTMLQEVSGLNVIERNEDGEIISSDPLLSSVAPFNLEQYKYFEIPGVGPVWVYNVSPKQVAVKNPITGKDKVLYSEASAGDRFGVVFDTYQSTPFWKFFDTAASSMKKLELGFSGFHAGALTEVYMVQNMVEYGPKKALANFMKYIFVDTMKNHQLPCFANPQDFQEAASHLVKFGATNDYAAADVQNMFDNFRDSMMKIQEKLDNGSKVAKAGATVSLPFKVASQMLSLINKGMDRALWDFLHDGLKLATYNMRAEKTKARAKAKGWTDEQVNKALDEDGQFVNDMFGGQHWDVLGASHRTLRYAGRVLLSPDWNASTTRHFLALTGYGSVWNEATMENFKEYYKNLWSAARGNGELSPDDWGRASRQVSALLCYGIGFMIFYEAFANAINAAFRAMDEEKEQKKAEEIRKTNPDYKSPYELAYPDGMKWYDYLMQGNTLGQQSKIFVGRYADGAEMYVRHGKQFREVPEYLFNHKGELEFPGPMVQRLIGKANPMVRMTLDDINYLSDFQASHADQDIQRKYGKTIGLLYKDALYWAPFLIPSQENKEFKAVDFFFPSSKGFSNWKAQDYFKNFILSGDMEGVMMTYQSCQRNGIDAEKQLQAAISSIKALESKEMQDGVTSLQIATKRFDEAKSITEKRKMREKMRKFLAQGEYKAFTAQEALDMVKAFQEGVDPKEMMKADDKYLNVATSADVTEDWRIQQVRASTKTYADKLSELKDTNKAKAGAFKNAHANVFKARKAISKATTKMNKLKKKLGEGNDKAILQQIRQIRKDLLKDLNGMEHLKEYKE